MFAMYISFYIITLFYRSFVYGWFMVFNVTFNNISVMYIVAVSFIGRGNDRPVTIH